MTIAISLGCANRRRGCRGGVEVGVVRPRGIERVEREVLVVSIDRLIPVPRSCAGLGRSADELGMRGRMLGRWE